MNFVCHCILLSIIIQVHVCNALKPGPDSAIINAQPMPPVNRCPYEESACRKACKNCGGMEGHCSGKKCLCDVACNI